MNVYIVEQQTADSYSEGFLDSYEFVSIHSTKVGARVAKTIVERVNLAGYFSSNSLAAAASDPAKLNIDKILSELAPENRHELREYLSNPVVATEEQIWSGIKSMMPELDTCPEVRIREIELKD
jgi:hypothetical protein